MAQDEQQPPDIIQDIVFKALKGNVPEVSRRQFLSVGLNAMAAAIAAPVANSAAAQPTASALPAALTVEEAVKLYKNTEDIEDFRLPLFFMGDALRNGLPHYLDDPENREDLVPVFPAFQDIALNENKGSAIGELVQQCRALMQRCERLHNYREKLLAFIHQETRENPHKLIDPQSNSPKSYAPESWEAILQWEGPASWLQGITFKWQDLLRCYRAGKLDDFFDRNDGVGDHSEAIKKIAGKDYKPRPRTPQQEHSHRFDQLDRLFRADDVRIESTLSKGPAAYSAIIHAPYSQYRNILECLKRAFPESEQNKLMQVNDHPIGHGRNYPYQFFDKYYGKPIGFLTINDPPRELMDLLEENIRFKRSYPGASVDR